MHTRFASSQPRLPVAAALALITGIGGVASGCSTGAPPAAPTSPDERAKATPPQHDQFAALGYRVDWRGFPTMLPGEKVKFMEILGDAVAVQETAGVVSLLEARSGQTRWSDQPGGKLTKYVGIVRNNGGAGDRLLVSSESEVFFYDIATGNLKNKQQLAQVVNTRPVQVGDFLIYGCTNGQVLGHYLANGFRAWGAGLTGAIETDLILLPSGRVGVSSVNGDVAVLDGVSGLSQGRARMYSGPGADLGASDSTFFIASTDQSLYAFTVDSCLPVWRKRTEHPLTRKPTFYNNFLFCDLGAPGIASGSETAGAGGMCCMEPGSGKIVWSNPGISGEVIALRNKRLIVWDALTASASALDLANGSIVATVKLDNISILRTDTFADGHLYAASPNGIVTKLSPK